jgi:hypothetical protein
MGFGAFQRNQIQKSLKNSHKGGVKNDKLFPKAWKRGEATKQKNETSKEDIKSHLDILSSWEHIYLLNILA